MKDNKEYQLATSLNEGICEIIITGEVLSNAVDKLLSEVNAIGNSMNVYAQLIDVRSAKGRFAFAESYFRVRDYPADRSRIKIAVVDLEENAGLQSFQEISAKNAGLSLKWFTDIDAARTWLKSK